MTKFTNWDDYYSKPYVAAAYTRRISTRILIRNIKKYTNKNTKLKIAELGGANSCFYKDVQEEILPEEYYIFDNNQLGLNKTKERIKNQNLTLVEADVLSLQFNLQFDLVFSVGLIEHFGSQDTIKAIKSHFSILKPGGIAIISYPTPTILYKITRFLSEVAGMWIFHDERPIRKKEVLAISRRYSRLINEKIIWSIFLTQQMLVMEKFNADE